MITQETQDIYIPAKDLTKDIRKRLNELLGTTLVKGDELSVTMNMYLDLTPLMTGKLLDILVDVPNVEIDTHGYRLAIYRVHEYISELEASVESYERSITKE